MATLISAYTPTVGVFILEDDATAWVGNNNPGLCDLDNLSEGDTYIYLETILRLDHQISTVGGGDFVGHSFSPVGAGSLGHTSGYDDIETLTVVAEVTNDVVEKAESFVKLNNRTGDGQKYLIQRYGAADWRQFPNAAGTLKKYIPVYTTNVFSLFTGEKDRQQITIQLMGAFAT